MLGPGARRHRLARTLNTAYAEGLLSERTLTHRLDLLFADVVIGRHPSCDVVMADETVSRRHVQLTFRDGGWIVRDLQSTNGTRLNGQFVGRCRLRTGDQLRLGNQLLQVD